MFKLSQLSFYNLLCRKVVICRNLYSHSLSLNCTFLDTVQHFNIAAVILSPWEEGFNACTSASARISTMITIQNFCQLRLFYTNCYRTLGLVCCTRFAEYIWDLCRPCSLKLTCTKRVTCFTHKVAVTVRSAKHDGA